MKANCANHRYLGARWVLPVSAPPLRDGFVAIEADRIVKIGCQSQLSRAEAKRLERFADCILLPGLINLHTHLEYSALSCFAPESALVPWIKALMRRFSRLSPADVLASARLGASAAALAGTSCLVDSSRTGLAARAAVEYGLRSIVGLEIFGLDDSKVERIWQTWLDRFAQLREAQDIQVAERSGLLTLTIAPHAPYTVCPQLWEKAADWAEDRTVPLLTHIAESQAESDWIASDCQLLTDFLLEAAPELTKDIVDKLCWRGRGLSPIEYLDKLGLLTRQTIAAHAVHLSNSDIEALSGRKIGIAHCPRSNAALLNGAAPLAKMLKEQLSVGLGTDSLACTDSLSLLDEARFAINLQRAMNPDSTFNARTALWCLTIGAARAAGIAGRTGSIDAGKFADLAIFKTHSQFDGDCRPEDLIIHGQTSLEMLLVGGCEIVRGGEIISQAGRQSVARTAPETRAATFF